MSCNRSSIKEQTGFDGMMSMEAACNAYPKKVILGLVFFGFYEGLQLAGSYAMLDELTPSGPEGSSGRLIRRCRRVPGHF